MQMRRHIHSVGAAVATALVAVLVLASAAEARQFAVTAGNIANLFTNQGLQVPIAPPQGPASGAIATATGSGPATLTLQPGVFSSAGVPFGFGLMTPPYIQLWTTAGLVAPNGAPAQFNAGLSSARPNANFDFCPGAAANPACTNPNIAPGQGTRVGIVQYDAGSNVFSGTMDLLVNGGGTVSVQIGPSRFRHVQIAGIPMVQGKPYGFQTFQTAAPTEVTLGGVVSSMGLINPKGVVTSTLAGETLVQTGFPFTTGMVRVYVPPAGTEPPTVFTVTGSDNRTPLGAGNITLVAGGVGETETRPFGTVVVMSMTLSELDNVPSTDRIGLAVLLTVIAASTFVFLRRRQSSGAAA